MHARVAQARGRQRAHYVGHANRRDWWMFQFDAVVPGCIPASADTSADTG